MLYDHLIGIISLVVGLVSFVAAVVFFALGARTERRNQSLLDKINTAIQSWQSEMMASNIELLNSRVEIVGKKVVLEDARTKHDFISQLAERITLAGERTHYGVFRIEKLQRDGGGRIGSGGGAEVHGRTERWIPSGVARRPGTSTRQHRSARCIQMPRRRCDRIGALPDHG